MAVEAMPPGPSVNSLYSLSLFPYLDSGQLCQSWCLHCLEWLCLSGSGLGTLDFPSLCLWPATSLLGPWLLFISFATLFDIFPFHHKFLLLNLSCTAFFLRFFCSTPRGVVAEWPAVPCQTVRHMEECKPQRRVTSAERAKRQRCTTDIDIMLLRQMCC